MLRRQKYTAEPTVKAVHSIVGMGAKGGLTAWLVVVALVAASVEMCAGRQHYRSRIPNGANVPCPPDHDYCAGELCVGVGHMSCLGGVVEPERNPFGKVRG